MSTADSSLSPADYGQVLASYIQNHDEEDLYRASDLSQVCIQSGMGPEDMVALHFEALEKVLPQYSYREHARIIGDAHQFLLEVMISYGVRYREYLEMKMVETVRDAESRVAREQERARELERLQKEKGEILAVIAHELRNPISVARGNVDLATRSLDEASPAKRYLIPAREALERLSRLSGDLVEASRGQPAQVELTPLDLSRIASQACNWASAAAENKGLTFTTNTGPDSIQVLGNSDALLSILGNLLSNAIRYTNAGGAIELMVGADEDEAWVHVRDTGIGMPVDVQARIFEKFYRGPEARSLEAKGLGLGLSLVLQLVEAHKGRIDIQTAPGEGSTFTVFMPRLQTAEQAPSQQTPDKQELPGN